MTHPTFILQPSFHLHNPVRRTVSGSLPNLSLNSFPIHSTDSTPTTNPASVPLQTASEYSNPLSPSASSKTAILWFRSDLRLHDNPALTKAIEYAGTASILPLYIFDSREYPKSTVGGVKTNATRHKFISQSLENLRQSLRKIGSDLVVRFGEPEQVIPQLASQVSATSVFCHVEHERKKISLEFQLENTLNNAGVSFYPLWSNTLYHIDDIPYSLNNIPDDFSLFKEQILAKSKPRPPLPIPDSMPGLPSIDLGEIPPLSQFALKDPPPVNFASQIIVGGETEALKALSAFLAKVSVPNISFTSLEHHVAGFSVISSLYAYLGCLSPRTLYADLCNQAPRAKQASVDPELLRRDYYRFRSTKIARKALRIPEREIPIHLIP